MAWKTLLSEQFGAILRITANRPNVLNAQSWVLIHELDDALKAAAEDDTVRVIIIAGAGKHFSAGHDLGSDEELEFQKTRQGRRYVDEYDYLTKLYFETCMRWRDVPKPTIAQVQGYCIMGGMMLASACDIIIAAEDALFADRAVRWGGPHVQYASLPWDVGPRKAKEYLFTGQFFTAADALKTGMVNHVVKREDLEKETMALAEKIAANDLFALRMAKLSVNETMDAMGQRSALERSYKNYMLTIPHRQDLGTYGSSARATSAKDRFAVLNKAPGQDPKA
ncbi:MAG: enoyl-CoA hydratase [Alphaproteobacteria bacterium]